MDHRRANAPLILLVGVAAIAVAIALLMFSPAVDAISDTSSDHASGEASTSNIDNFSHSWSSTLAGAIILGLAFVLGGSVARLRGAG
jgi:hypothetical protein